jgi:putative peptidoglycan lipid II flippase
MPAATALIIAAKPIIMGLFNYGAFTVADTSVTSLVLTCYALGLPAYIVAKVFQSACFARQDTKTPVKISMICALTNIALGLTFSQYIGVAGIALATAFSGFIQVVLLYRITRTIDHLGFDDQLKRNAFKIMLSCIIMACAIWGYTQILGANFEQANTGRVLTLIGLVASGGLAYLLSITFMRVINIRDIRNMMKKKA